MRPRPRISGKDPLIEARRQGRLRSQRSY